MFIKKQSLFQIIFDHNYQNILNFHRSINKDKDPVGFGFVFFLLFLYCVYLNSE